MLLKLSVLIFASCTLITVMGFKSCQPDEQPKAEQQLSGDF